MRVLFLCTGNSCRSQMAEGWARALRSESIEPYSAGTEPQGLNPLAVRAMREAGVDISGHRSKRAQDLGVDFDVVVTVCDAAHEVCPVWPGARVVHAGFDDPPRLAKGARSEEEAMPHYRRVRDEIRGFVETLPQALRGGSRMAGSCCDESCCPPSADAPRAEAGGDHARLRAAHEGDEPGIVALLNDAGLPTADLPAGRVRFAIAEEGTRLCGVVGLEVYGRVALLRSLAAATDRRRGGLGGRLVDHACALATLGGVQELYLLTTTAAEFFERRGFERVERDLVPAVLRGSTEFASLCPSSAVCMRRSLAGQARYFPREALALRADASGAAFWAVQLERVMLTRFEVPPNARFPRHSHDAEQITLVLEGSLEFECDGRPPVRVCTGETIAIPSGVPHAVTAGERGAVAIDAWSPPHALYAASPEPRTEENREEEDAVRTRVREGYTRIAQGGCCGPSGSAGGCCGGAGPTPDELAQAIGYSGGELAEIPESANMGLSCGNPTALASLSPGEVVLDLGAGGGFDCFVAGPKVGAGGRVIGVDMTPDMIGKARRGGAAYRAQTGLDNVEFRLGEIEALPVADASVDVVISNCVLNLSPDKARVWREIARVLKPGGRVAVSDLALLKPLPESVKSDVQALVGCVAGAVLVDETREMAAAAGLSEIVLTPKPRYIESMTDWQDPLYRRIIAGLPAGSKASDYITSLDVSARKVR